MSKKSLILIFAIALAARAVLYVPLGETYYMGGTTVYHGLVARSILEGKGVTVPIEAIQRWEHVVLTEGKPAKMPEYAALPWEESDTFFPMIRYASLYSLLLAGYIGAVPDFEWRDAQIPQMILDAFSAVLIACAAFRLGLGRRTATLAGLLCAVSIQLARNSMVIIHDGPTPAVMAIALWCLSVVLSSDDRRFARLTFLFGLALAVAAYFRPNIMLLPFFLSAGLLWVKPGKPFWKFTGWMFLAFCLAIVPQTIRNYRCFGQFVPLTASVSTSFLIDLNGWRTDWDVAQSEPNAPATSELHYPDPFQRDKVRTRIAWEYIKEHKLEFLKVTATTRPKNLLFSSWKIGVLGSDTVKSAIRWGVNFSEALVYLLFLIGAYGVFRERSPALLMAIVPLYFFVTLVPMHAEARYLWPAYPALYLIAAEGAMRVWRMIRAEKGEPG